MHHYYENIEKETLENDNYRKVVFTVPNLFQLVLMSLLPGEEIGEEIHPHTTQFIRVEKGFGTAIINGKLLPLKDGSAVVIPPGASHNIINLSHAHRLKLYTIYTPPEHPPHTLQKKKKE